MKYYTLTIVFLAIPHFQNSLQQISHLQSIIVMKGYSLTDHQAIRNSQLNTSTAKQSHVFAKSERFKMQKPYCPLPYYQHKSQLSARKTSLGYGNKYDFTRSSVYSPSPTNYLHTSVFAKNPKKGKTFGIARQKSPQFGIQVRDILKFPGPGRYEAKRDTLSTISYSMRPQTIDFIERKLTYKDSPGPGNYQHLQAFPSNGKAYFSKFNTSKFAKINQSVRFQTLKDTPSPHTYDVRNDFTSKGKYLLSRDRGHGTRAFCQTARSSFTDEKAQNSISPGPGVYQRPSDFGVYGDSKYYRTLSIRNKDSVS